MLKSILIAGLCMMFFSAQMIASPQHCMLPRFCEAMAYSEQVFKGRLLSVADTKEYGYTEAEFEILTKYKGSAEKKAKVYFYRLNFEQELKIGTIYLVFDYGMPQLGGVCNLTKPIQKVEASDLLMLTSEYVASGSVQGLTEVDRRKIKVTATSGSSRHSLDLGSDNSYRFTTFAPGVWQIRVELPRKFEITVRDLAFYDTDVGDLYEYSVDAVVGSCNYKEIQLVPK